MDAIRAAVSANLNGPRSLEELEGFIEGIMLDVTDLLCDYFVDIDDGPMDEIGRLAQNDIQMTLLDTGFCENQYEVDAILAVGELAASIGRLLAYEIEYDSDGMV